MSRKMNASQLVECSRCGGRATFENETQLLAHARRLAAYGACRLDTRAVRALLHVIGTTLFGVPRFRCRECGERFSPRGRAVSDVSQTERAEVEAHVHE
jgi:hypothetical protein